MPDHIETQSSITPIQAFFAQTRIGNSRLWTWLAVFWFALVMWLYGQLLFGIPMFGIGYAIDPGSFNVLMEASREDTGNSQLELLAGLFAFGAPILAILLYLLRGQFAGRAKHIVLGIAAACAILSMLGIIYTIVATGSGAKETEVINSLISQSPWVYLFMLLMFPPLAAGLWLGQKFIHKRSIKRLHTAHYRFRWGRLFFSMIVFWLIASGLSYFGHASDLSKAEFVFDPSRFWAYLPITLLFIPLQSATEEILLRGYLNQGLGHYLKNPWIVFFITSAAFALLHIGNPEVAEGSKETSKWIVLSGYFFFGFFACVLTYIDGGLETAIGVHAANNMFAAAIVGYENSALPTPTVFRVGLDMQMDSIMTVVSLSLVCLVMFLTRKPVTLDTETL